MGSETVTDILPISTSSLSLKNDLPTENTDSKTHDWHVGQRVMAIFSEDGLEYRAKILQVKDWKGAAVVKYADYGNEEEVNFTELSKIKKKPSKVFNYKH